MTTFLNPDSMNIITTLPQLEAALTDGSTVHVMDDTLNLIKSVRFPKKAETNGKTKVYLHGGYARDLAQVVSYINGDAHDRSKIEFFDGAGFQAWF